jgi:hypothetical protein
VRDRLRKEYDDAFRCLEDQMFAKIKTGHLLTEANADPPRFVAKYFLDAQGRPNKNKTKEPLVLQWWYAHDEFDSVVKAVPGLAIHNTGNGTVLVG